MMFLLFCCVYSTSAMHFDELLPTSTSRVLAGGGALAGLCLASPHLRSIVVRLKESWNECSLSRFVPNRKTLAWITAGGTAVCLAWLFERRIAQLEYVVNSHADDLIDHAHRLDKHDRSFEAIGKVLSHMFSIQKHAGWTTDRAGAALDYVCTKLSIERWNVPDKLSYYD